MHILIVDDEIAVCESLSRTLRFEGYRISVAHDGNRAISRIRSDHPDGVILDVMMPGCNGLEVCRLLRAEGNAVPILLLTARDEITDTVAGLDAGADDYLAKPFALQELLARVRALLRRNPAAQNGDWPSWLEFADLALDPARPAECTAICR